MDKLPKRQAQLLKLLSYGLSNRDAARKMGISEACVKKYIKNIVEKTNTQNRTAAVAKAIRDGILD